MSKLMRKYNQRKSRSGRHTSLIELAKRHGTDKWGSHWYAEHYERHFSPRRFSLLNILEIGIGGYDNPDAGGESLRMWKDFFPRGTVYGLDIYDKQAHAEDRIRIYQGDQYNSDILERISREAEGGLDIIVDDGSHLNNDVIESFQRLFPLMNDNGIYVIEDLQTSYWAGFGGGPTNEGHTSMCMLKSMTDGLNYEEFDSPGYEPSYSDRNIKSLHFYHNMAFIYKGDNNEGSNLLTNNIFNPPPNSEKPK